ncbi:hypothetical protein BDP81DRAFT_501482 [Colletotrichum phormii]|uniref:Uncharacterized protein n=1 Tax=Colletotrichum phormii TaxID=359342 RepID=A0AAI9ZHA3_9PEZI|nr:uncharacterized protein BDP81DRAFT_501482 [Colletotrichum phormii]KAK1624574.1 hypothetical protein BDP81DRAFT_501482 [Colletotrichum phormii]
MLSGQPVRASELVGLQTVNTVNRSVRNILVYNKYYASLRRTIKGTGRQARRR